MVLYSINKVWETHKLNSTNQDWFPCDRCSGLNITNTHPFVRDGSPVFPEHEADGVELTRWYRDRRVKLCQEKVDKALVELNEAKRDVESPIMQEVLS